MQSTWDRRHSITTLARGFFKVFHLGVVFLFFMSSEGHKTKGVPKSMTRLTGVSGMWDQGNECRPVGRPVGPGKWMGIGGQHTVSGQPAQRLHHTYRVC